MSGPLKLRTTSNFADPDAAFRLVVEAHRGLSEAEGAAFDAALTLLLANHIGDLDVLREAVGLAQRHATAGPDLAASSVPDEDNA